MHTLFFPAAAMALWTFLIATLMFLNRVSALRRREIKPSYFRLFTTQESEVPTKVVQFSRHYSNLFEMPILFYAVVLFAIILGLGADKFMLTSAWGFVVTRFVHSVIHLTYNNPNHRVIPFTLSTIILTIMWIKLVVAQITY